MAREKIQIKKIANKAARHVTFSKRRRGLVKKAQELSILCEADIALIIFSTTGKLFEFSSSSMEVILDKYSRISNTTKKDGKLNYQIDNIDTRDLKQQMEDTSHVLSQLRGQNLESLSLKELQLLETKLHKGLIRIRSTKDNSLAKEVDDLHKKVNFEFAQKFLLLLMSNYSSCKEIQMREGNAKLRRQETQDHAQSSKSMCTAYSFNLNKDYEPSDPLQLRLCLHTGI